MIAALADSQSERGNTVSDREALKKRVSDAEARLQRLQVAIEAGVDPAALVDAINTAQNERATAHAELTDARPLNTLADAEIHAMIDSLGDVGCALNSGRAGQADEPLHSA